MRPSFIDNVSAAVDRLGVEAVGIILGIGRTNWETADQRDKFLDAISGDAIQ